MRWQHISAILLVASAALADRDEVASSSKRTTEVIASVRGGAQGSVGDRRKGKGVDGRTGDEAGVFANGGRKEKRKLTGRFIHITDFHPDWHYTAGASFTSGCHRVEGDKDDDMSSLGRPGEDDLSTQFKGKKKHRGPLMTAGKWGTSNSDCDAPLSLVNHTLNWLETEWREEVDFVIWTGDSARHDIDREIPRTMKEIGDSNRWMTRRMREVFGKDVKVVPSLGNNDIYPHNILMPGPNRVTDEFADIWSPFIPDEQYHVFQRGAYYSVEVIPDKLAVISLNTIYWYDSNKAVDGCKLGSDEPGALQFDWLEVQLESFRERGMQVWLSGHVPPHEGLYFDNCYLRYGQLGLRFQDTILGHLYGHMNVDHFFFMGVKDLEAMSVSSSFTDRSPSAVHLTSESSLLADRKTIHTMGRTADTKLQGDLSDTFKGMPKIKKWERKLDDYVVINVGPSVVPTYLPSVRVYSYNITDLHEEEEIELTQRALEVDLSTVTSMLSRIPTMLSLPGFDIASSLFSHLSDALKRRKKKKRSKKDCSRSENEDKPHCAFKRKPRYASPLSPSRTNTKLSPLGWAQFYLPKMDEQRGKGFEEPPRWELEYTTYSKEALLRGLGNGRSGGDGPEGGLGCPPPVPARLLPGYENWKTGLEAGLWTMDELDDADEDELSADEHDSDTNKETFAKTLKRITPYKMKDLTIRSYAKFAKQLADDTGLWDKFANSMYVSVKK